MTKEEKNDLIYVCSLIEYIARFTKNRVVDIVKILGKKELKRQLYLAEVNHCLSFEQVANEIIEEFDIEQGSFDSVGNCKYKVPSYIAIGKDYQRLIEDVSNGKSIVDTLYEVMTSFISEEIANYNSSLYYSSRKYLKACYEAGMILD
jgi:transcription initiation factor IIE alpha subunit